MNETPFEGSFQTTTRDLEHAALVAAAGFKVQITRQSYGRRALFTFNDTPEIRALIAQYENRQLITIPAKTFIIARNRLFHDARRICTEAV